MTESSRHLAKTWPYKRQLDYEHHLRQAAAAWFQNRGYEISGRYDYVLAEWAQWPRNIILPEVAAYIEETRGDRQIARVGFPLHKFIHHGLSSQAMLFNLVGPLMVRHGGLAPLQAALAQAGVPWPEGNIRAALEVEDRQVFNEDSGQPTSIDLVLDGATGSAPLFIEAKLVEKEFGGCSVFAGGDCDGQNAATDHSLCYLHHIGRLYWQRLEEQGFLQGPMKDSPVCLLAAYYQFFREVLFALIKGGHFVLLYDERNPVFLRSGVPGPRGLWPFLTRFVPEKHQSRIHAVTLQQLVAAVEKSEQHADWIGEFKKKYGLA
jgi:POLQ-like helicase